MSQSIWNIYTDGKDEFDYLFYSAEFLGRWEESIEVLSKDTLKKEWSNYSTFTKKDYDESPEEYEDFPIEYDELPDEKNLFAPKEGISRFNKLLEIVKNNSSVFEEDYDLLVKDIEQILILLDKAKEENRKWYLEFDVDY